MIRSTILTLERLSWLKGKDDTRHKAFDERLGTPDPPQASLEPAFSTGISRKTSPTSGLRGTFCTTFVVWLLI